MTDEQKILLALVKLMFPREMLDYFEVVGFELQEAYGNYAEEDMKYLFGIFGINF